MLPALPLFSLLLFFLSTTSTPLPLQLPFTRPTPTKTTPGTEPGTRTGTRTGTGPIISPSTYFSSSKLTRCLVRRADHYPYATDDGGYTEGFLFRPIGFPETADSFCSVIVEFESGGGKDWNSSVGLCGSGGVVLWEGEPESESESESERFVWNSEFWENLEIGNYWAGPCGRYEVNNTSTTGSRKYVNCSTLLIGWNVSQSGPGTTTYPQATKIICAIQLTFSLRFLSLLSSYCIETVIITLSVILCCCCYYVTCCTCCCCVGKKLSDGCGEMEEEETELEDLSYTDFLRQQQQQLRQGQGGRPPRPNAGRGRGKQRGGSGSGSPGSLSRRPGRPFSGHAHFVDTGHGQDDDDSESIVAIEIVDLIVISPDEIVEGIPEQLKEMRRKERERQERQQMLARRHSWDATGLGGGSSRSTSLDFRRLKAAFDARSESESAKASPSSSARPIPPVPPAAVVVVHGATATPVVEVEVEVEEEGEEEVEEEYEEEEEEGDEEEYEEEGEEEGEVIEIIEIVNVADVGLSLRTDTDALRSSSNPKLASPATTELVIEYADAIQMEEMTSSEMDESSSSDDDEGGRPGGFAIDFTDAMAEEDEEELVLGDSDPDSSSSSDDADHDHPEQGQGQIGSDSETRERESEGESEASEASFRIIDTEFPESPATPSHLSLPGRPNTEPRRMRSVVAAALASAGSSTPDGTSTDFQATLRAMLRRGSHRVGRRLGLLIPFETNVHGTWRGNFVTWKRYSLSHKEYFDWTQVDKKKFWKGLEMQVRISMSLTAHPRFLKVHGMTTDYDNLRFGVVTNLVDAGNVYYAFDRQLVMEYPDRHKKLQWLTHVCNAMKFLHSRNIYHGSLRMSNLYIDDKVDSVNIGFGFERFFLRLKREDASFASFQDFYHIAPEITRGECVTRDDHKGADVFAFAFLLYELLSEDFEPLSSETVVGSAIARRIANDPSFRPKPEVREEIGCDKVAIDLMVMCWEARPNHRPTMSLIYDCLLDLFHGVM